MIELFEDIGQYLFLVLKEEGRLLVIEREEQMSIIYEYRIFEEIFLNDSGMELKLIKQDDVDNFIFVVLEICQCYQDELERLKS